MLQISGPEMLPKSRSNLSQTDIILITFTVWLMGKCLLAKVQIFNKLCFNRRDAHCGKSDDFVQYCPDFHLKTTEIVVWTLTGHFFFNSGPLLWNFYLQGLCSKMKFSYFYNLHISNTAVHDYSVVNIVPENTVLYRNSKTALIEANTYLNFSKWLTW